jgi:hypothetical protein
MLITVVSVVFSLGLVLALYQRARRARLRADPDGPRTLMPGMKA